ncbi:MAG: hypothetical protein IIB64_05675 [Proteobacteria bacterium]|nr:hypothetical protein [Pseudomonadota bacterium]
MKEPKDLGVRIGTKAEAEWKKNLANSEELLVTGKANVEINELIIELAKKRIEEEKAKFK